MRVILETKKHRIINATIRSLVGGNSTHFSAARYLHHIGKVQDFSSWTTVTNGGPRLRSFSLRNVSMGTTSEEPATMVAEIPSG